MITVPLIALIAVYLWMAVAAFVWEADYQCAWPLGWKDWCWSVFVCLIWPLYPALRILGVIKR